MFPILALVLSLFGATPAAAQGCGPQNPNCIVPTAPVGTSNNQAASTEFVQSALPTVSILSIPGASSDCATANDAALTTAYNALPPNGGVILFPVPSQGGGCYAFANSITIGNGTSSAQSTKTNIKLVGASTASAGGNVTTEIPAVKLKFIGSAGTGFFVKFAGPGIFGMENIELDSNAFKTNWGIWLQHVYQSTFKNLVIKDFAQIGIRHQPFTTLPTGLFIGACDNRFEGILITSPGNLGTIGADIGFDTADANNFDVCRDVWTSVQTVVSDSTSSVGVLLRGTDALTFNNLFTFSPSQARAWGVFVIPPTGNTFLPHNITFNNAALIGGVFTPTDGSWTPRTGGISNQGLNFYPLQVGDMWNPAITRKPLPTNTFGGLSGFSTSGTLISGVHVRAVVGVTDTILSSDANALVTYSNAAPVAVTLPQSDQFTPFGAGFRTTVQNRGAGTVTITPTTSTINGGASLALVQNQSALIFADGAGNYNAVVAGTVSNVALTMPGVFSVAGSPITSTGTLAVTANGTSGGIPYFNSATTMASSGVLASLGIVVGGGAGATPTTSGCTVDGNNSLACASTGSNLPQFNLTNTTSDANAAFTIIQKNRSGGNTNSADTLGTLLFGGFANSSQRFPVQVRGTQTAASSGSNIPAALTLSTSNAAGLLNQVLQFDANAHLAATAQATAPSLTAGCNGAGSSVTSGGGGGARDLHGTATGQTAAVTTCTLSFGTTYTNTPDCTATGLSSPLTGTVTISTTTLDVNFASTANYKFTFNCWGT